MNNWGDRVWQAVYRWLGLDRGPEGFDEFLDLVYFGLMCGAFSVGPGFALLAVLVGDTVEASLRLLALWTPKWGSCFLAAIIVKIWLLNRRDSTE